MWTFNDYVDKKKWVGVPKRYIFVNVRVKDVRTEVGCRLGCANKDLRLF